MRLIRTTRFAAQDGWSRAACTHSPATSADREFIAHDIDTWSVRNRFVDGVLLVE